MRSELSVSGTVTEAIYGAGFNSNGRFYANSQQVLGMTPTTFRAGGKGAAIHFAVGECSLGSILVAATASGICMISLGDDPSALVRHLEDRFRQAELIGGDREFEKLVARVVAFVERPAQGLDLPLDVQGTTFQLRVWQLLSKIPCGETASYAEIAARAGNPRATRAVAQACAANKVAVAIPCHRVVRSDGSLSGYRWGVERKAKLLEAPAPGKLTPRRPVDHSSGAIVNSRSASIAASTSSRAMSCQPANLWRIIANLKASNASPKSSGISARCGERTPRLFWRWIGAIAIERRFVRALRILRCDLTFVGGRFICDDGAGLAAGRCELGIACVARVKILVERFARLIAGCRAVGFEMPSVSHRCRRISATDQPLWAAPSSHISASSQSRAD